MKKRFKLLSFLIHKCLMNQIMLPIISVLFLSSCVEKIATIDSKLHSPSLPKISPSLPKINVENFGAKGDDDRDDTEAIIAASKVAWFVNGDLKKPKSGTLYFPQGKYILSQPLEYEEHTNLDIRRSIIGAGPNLSQILINNLHGFFSWTKTNSGLFLLLENFSLIANFPKITYGVKIKQAANGTQNGSHIIVRNVRMKSAATLNSFDRINYFDTALDIFGGGNGVFENLFISGVRLYNSNNRFDTWKAEAGVKLTNHSNPSFFQCGVWGAHFGYIHKASNQDNSAIGGVWNQTIADSRIGWDIKSFHDEEGPTIKNSHANFGQKALRIVGRKKVKIEKNIFFNETTTDQSSIIPIDIEFDHVDEALINSNQFFFGSNPERIAIFIKDTSYSLSDSITGNFTITNNQFLYKGHGINIHGDINKYRPKTSVLKNNIFGKINESVIGIKSAPNLFWKTNENNISFSN